MKRVRMFVGCLAGFLALSVWFNRYSPEATWTVVPREQQIAKARQVAEHFGLNVNGWDVHVIAGVSNKQAFKQQQYPDDPRFHEVSPLTVRITFVPHPDGPSAEVWLDSAGLPIYWRAPDGFKSPKSYDSAASAAQGAFQFLAGTHTGSYVNPSHPTGDDDDEYVWKKAQPAAADFKESIKVVAKASGIVSAQRFTGEEGEEVSLDNPDPGDGQHYWGVFVAAITTFVSICVVVVAGIYILWLARKAVNHKLPVRMAAVLAVVIAASMIWGFEHERLIGHAGKETNVQADRVFVALFWAGLLMCLVTVGRGISVPLREKWMTLEQIFWLAPISKSAGASLLAGILYSPLLVAVPYFIAATQKFQHGWVLPLNAQILYSRAPLLDSIDLRNYIYAILFFGFVLPVVERFVPMRFLARVLILPVGILYFGGSVLGPLPVALEAGLATYIVYRLVWVRFDLLAVLTMQTMSSLFIAALMLWQKSESYTSLLVVMVGLLGAALWFRTKGQDVSAGDPNATNPALISFRDEREKLRAEFSVARRAQQDMLPQRPPQIPGYSIAASCTPSLEVGGDLYDFLLLQDGRVGIGVADVSGKGVPAALYMTLTKGLLSSVIKGTSELSAVVEQVNKYLHGVTRKKVFVTMALGFLDTEKRIMQCVRAGHNPVVWRKTGQNATTLVAPGGLGLGITAGRVFGTQLKVAEMALSEGDTVVFYSDGITEAMNSELEQFGEDRLMQAVEKTDNMDATTAHDSILHDVRDFLNGVHPQDDMTLVVLRVGAN